MMITKALSSWRTLLRLTAACWWMLLPGNACFGQYIGGDLISAIPQSPIVLGEPLRIMVTVSNSTDFTWQAEMEYPWSWFTEVTNATWRADLDIYQMSYNVVVPGETDSILVQLDAAALPNAPGTYQLSLGAAFNLLDWEIVPMDGSPMTVSFTINPGGTANTPPVITPIGDKTALEGIPLTFQAVATDTNIPAQTLTWSLLSGALYGANIDPASGVFTWTPPAGVIPRTNQFTVQVTDNGTPPLSATNTFNVVVAKPLRFLPMPHPVNNLVSLSWESFVGKTYRLRYRTNLTTSPWLSHGNDILAIAPLTAVTNNMGTTRQRYYQLLLLD